jgi:hypothetical protein
MVMSFELLLEMVFPNYRNVDQKEKGGRSGEESDSARPAVSGSKSEVVSGTRETFHESLS